MKESFAIPYEIRVLKKIRKDLINCLGHLRFMKINIHYSLSPSIPDYPIYNLPLNDYGNSQQKNIIKIREKLENDFGEKILITSRNEKSLRINVSKIYSEIVLIEHEELATSKKKVEQNASRLISFKNILVAFIHKKTAVRLNDTNNGFQLISVPGKSGKKWVIIHCFSNHAQNEIVKALEKDSYYGNKISINGEDIHVSDYEKPHARKELPLIKEFIVSLRTFANPNGPVFETETPLLVIASQDVSQISLKFINLKSLSSFVSKVNDEWLPKRIDNSTVSMTVTKKQIKEFLGKE